MEISPNDWYYTNINPNIVAVAFFVPVNAAQSRNQGGSMSRRKRMILAVIGLLLLAFALAALSYAFSPSAVLRDQAPIAPTLLTLPPGGG